MVKSVLPKVRLRRTSDRQELRQIYWSADLFVNPSVHPDENFGITPREALACAVPLVTTNFAGLRPLADAMPWGGLDTYPAVAGSVFSLRELKDKIDQAGSYSGKDLLKNCRNLIVEENDPRKTRRNLSRAVSYLAGRAPETCKDALKFEVALKRHFIESFSGSAYRYFGRKMTDADGASAYGASLMRTDNLFIQSLYSSKRNPPWVRFGSCWGGFFRLGLWRKERTIVIFDFPGPRLRRYNTREWKMLSDCALRSGPREYCFVPRNKAQAGLIQTLVNLGYLVFWGR